MEISLKHRQWHPTCWKRRCQKYKDQSVSQNDPVILLLYSAVFTGSN